MKIAKVDSAILEWVDRHQIRNSRNDPFEFDLHSFLLDPICDWSRQIVVRKSAQIGFSETFGILKTIFAAQHMGLSSIYTNPTNSASDTFVSTKVNPIIDKNPVILDSIGVSKLDEKHIGDRFVFFRGTHSTEIAEKKADTDKAISITSDLNIYDERDRSDQFVIDQYSSRLENSDYGGEWSFSNPSYPGVGSDQVWENSDKKHWFVTCEHCGHRQYLDWVKLGEESGVTDHCKIDVENKEFVCGKCGLVISDTARMRGEWVAMHPDKEISGYWMSQLNYVKHALGDMDGKKGLLSKEKTQTPQTFNNFVLGRPYRESTSNVDRNMVINNILMTENTKENVYMGVDQGVKKYYVLGDDVGVFEVGVTESWDVIDKLIRKYNTTCVIDNGPDRKMPERLAKKYDGRNGGPRVYRCHYSGGKDAVDMIRWGKKDKRSYVYVQRTMAFDLLVDFFVNQMFPINIPAQLLDEYIEHWLTMNRIEKEDRDGIMRPKWESSNGRDHYCHATLYQWVAASKVKGVGSVDSFERPVELAGVQGVEVDDNWTSALPSLKQKLYEANRGLY